MHALYTLIIFKFIHVKGGHRESIEYIYQHLKFMELYFWGPKRLIQLVSFLRDFQSI